VFVFISLSDYGPVSLDLKGMKRKIDSINEQEDAVKRLKLTDSSGSKTPPEPEPVTTSDSLPLLETEIVPNANEGKGEDMEEPETEEHEGRSKPQDQSKAHQRRRINKLVPPRPFPTVPTSVSATGPRSNHKEGKNLICITRKTSLSCYIRRCKDVIIQDG
jgi:hypothetical protein